MAHTVLTGPLLVQILGRGAAHVERNAASINALNVFPVPDGDTGTNMALTLRAAVDQVADLTTETLAVGDAAKHISRGVLLGARGNSGVILSQFLRGFAEGLAGKTSAGPTQFAHALEQGTAFAYRAVIKPVEGTMLTVGKGASTAARAAADAGENLAGVLLAAAEGAERALAKTPEQLPVLKRAGVVDAGGKGLLCFLEGALEACRGLPMADEGEPEASGAEEYGGPTVASEDVAEALAQLHRELDPEDIVYRYCTEFLIQGAGLSPDEIRQHLLHLGDSLLVVGDDTVVKVHLHTEHPGRALEVGVTYGDLLGISIDNMRQQQQRVAALAAKTTSASEADANGRASEASPSATEGSAPLGGGADEAAGRSAVVAVVQGEGWEQLLASLGVEGFVQGGQTMNPSAAELLEAIEAASAPAVIVLPNNGNVVFAARQAQQLTDKVVYVVETTTPASGVAAMLAFNPLGDPAEIARTMDAAVRRVRTAEIACAVRDSDGWEDGIKTGDRLGIVDGDIRVVAPDEEEAVLETLRHILDEESSFISIYYGDDVVLSKAEKLAAAVRRAWPDCDVELVRGGQRVYSYILSTE